MTRVRVLAALIASAVFVSLPGSPAPAAPVPKGAGTGEATPDLKAFFGVVGKAVKDEKRPAEADEKLLRGTAETVFARALKAADQKERKLPVDFAALTKTEMVKEFKEASLKGGFVIAENVRGERAEDSVIFATGDVQLTTARNCVIVAKNVRCTVVENCTVVAGESIRLTGAHRRDGGDGSVLVAGHWIRTTSMDGTICHVLRPTGSASPDEAKRGRAGPHPAIQTNSAKGVFFLNERTETSANGPRDCTYLPQKNPIAK